ncbi:M48 family peptidase [Phyllobacterium salinisoli]|uniref:M48 family peptidase n=1 Tax=Phyllobacterium salinisoli TaxID=1899321 RepID=A0A368JYT7_9HYPH|nr:M48 family metallopeptidase [Phyllobacterium salinisoli]RCS22309.1 M48 family peptidase [Phyllobacterium salinisoli]
MVLSLFRAAPKKAPQATSDRAYEVAGRTLPLRVVENPRATRLTLRIEAGGKGLRVTIPPGLPAREVDRFLSRHEGWIEARIAKLPDRPAVRPGIKIPIRGVPHLVVHAPGRGTAQMITGDDGAPALVIYGDRLHLSRRIADFLKREARTEMEALVARHTATVGRRAKTIRYKDTKSRWGSCTSDGVLSFSWRIAMAPGPVINYLVAHEVAHLIEMNHGPKFWKLCRELCPDTDRCKAWLKRNGSALQAIDFS